MCFQASRLAFLLQYRCNITHRLWWRDTRISEVNPLASLKMPSTSKTTGYEYPIFFLSVPSFNPLPLSYLLSTVIPAASSSRSVSMNSFVGSADHSMELDCLVSNQVNNFESDGLLLYHSAASYEPGTSPLSLWLPLIEEHSGTQSCLSTFYS